MEKFSKEHFYHINGKLVEIVDSFTYLVVNIDKINICAFEKWKSSKEHLFHINGKLVEIVDSLTYLLYTIILFISTIIASVMCNSLGWLKVFTSSFEWQFDLGKEKRPRHQVREHLDRFSKSKLSFK